MNKTEYREYFAECKKLIKLSYVCKMCGIPQSHLAGFMGGYDYALSIDKLEIIRNTLISLCEKIA